MELLRVKKRFKDFFVGFKNNFFRVFFSYFVGLQRKYGNMNKKQVIRRGNSFSIAHNYGRGKKKKKITSNQSLPFVIYEKRWLFFSLRFKRLESLWKAFFSLALQQGSKTGPSSPIYIDYNHI